MRRRDLLAAGVAYLGLFTFGRREKASARGRRLLSFGGAYSGMGGFGCGLHLGLWCRRFLDLHWLSKRGLFFAGAGCCCFSWGGSTLTRRRSLLARSAPLAS